MSLLIRSIYIHAILFSFQIYERTKNQNIVRQVQSCIKIRTQKLNFTISPCRRCCVIISQYAWTILISLCNILQREYKDNIKQGIFKQCHVLWLGIVHLL